MHTIRKERFDALVGYSRLPHSAAMTRELEWHASEDEILLATILVDDEGEFAAIILGRDADCRYRCIEALASFSDVEDARKTMLKKAMDVLAKGLRIFPQRDERGMKLDIFAPLYETSKLNPNFDIVRTRTAYSSAKEIIAEAMHHYVDVDGNFVEQFQTSGFDSRLWELYLFTYFTEESLLIDRSHNAPDFLVTNGAQTVAIEAVTVQPTQGKNAEEIDIEKLTPQQVQELLRHYMPIKFGSPLYSKLEKKYWEKAHVKDIPLVFAIADFHGKQSMLWSSPALLNYLYGVTHDFHFSEDGKLVISPLKIDFHEYKGKKIASGFFFTKDTEHVAAVLFSATGTISKFIRMGKLAGFGTPSVKILYQGTCHKHDPNAVLPDRFLFEVDAHYEETWGEGVSIFHNPRAHFPLSRDIFPSAAHHYMDTDGQIISYLPEFHPYNGVTVMLQSTDNSDKSIAGGVSGQKTEC